MQPEDKHRIPSSNKMRLRNTMEISNNNISNMKQQRRRMSLLALLSWFSAATASPSLQHRVRSPERVLEYQHVLENRPRGYYEKFRIPSSQRGSRRLARNPEAQIDVQNYLEEDEIVWDLSVQGGRILLDEDVNTSPPPTRRSLKDSFPFGTIRNLFEQFIGQELEGADPNSTTVNITTEVSNATVNETAIFTTTADDVNATELLNITDPEQEVFQPIRLRAILAGSAGNGELLTEEERFSLFHDMLSPALLSWSNVLRVDPVVGNLTVDVTQLFDGETCGPGIDSGLPSIRVPLGHLDEGVPDTDMIVYLSLGFVVPRFNVTNSTAAPSESSENHGEDSNKKGGGDTRHLLKYENNTLNLGQEPGQNAQEYNDTRDDMGALTAAGVCTGDYLAAASFCSTDQYDRPTAALLHICIDEAFFDPARRNRNIHTMMHELAHALGFNSLSMAHFRRVDGTPYTRRVDGDVPDTEIECTGTKEDRRRGIVALPSEEILQFREVRGGVRVAELVTPSVLQVVRNQFGCQNLTGAELESDEELPLATADQGYGCLGDHWERRLFSSDLMNPVIDDLEYSPQISTLTLAYFADSGWYQIDLSGSRVASGWGRAAGCGFVTEACISKNGQVPRPNSAFFCNEIQGSQPISTASDVNFCTPDLSRKAICSMGHHGLELPWEYQYFQDTYGSDVGGNDPLMDYCPVYIGYENGLCASADTRNFMLASTVEKFGERNSRCLVGNLKTSTQRSTALCLPIACVVEDRSLRFKLDNTWHRCEAADQEISSGSITIVCPDPVRICPTFYCPYDCLGTPGQCDYSSGQCLCEVPSLLEGVNSTLRPCGTEEEDDSRAFFRPSEPDEDDSALPHADSPLYDYYVVTERALEGTEERPLVKWVVALIGVSCAVFASFGFLLFYVSKSGERESIWAPAWFYRPNSEQPEVFDVEAVSRNKDKMIATLLVDMRIRSNDPGRESLAETDEQLTDSDASGGGPPSESMSEYSSSRQAETLSDFDTTLDDITEEDIQELQESAQVIRRRRLGNETAFEM